MREISHSEAPLFVGMIFLIVLMLAGLFIVIHHFFQKKNFPDNVGELKDKHEKLINKNQLKAAVHLCYSYLKTIDKDSEESGLVYYLLSQNFDRLGSVSDSVYFAHIAAIFFQKSNTPDESFSGDSEGLKKEIKHRVTEMEANLSVKERFEVLKKIELFDTQGIISFPYL